MLGSGHEFAGPPQVNANVIESIAAEGMVWFSGMVTIKFQSESPSFKETLNRVSSVSLITTASTALARARCHSRKQPWKQPGSSVKYETTCVNEGRRVSYKCPLLARAYEKVLSKETDEA